MTEFPFTVTIKPVSSSTAPQTITYIGLLRSLGKKRRVFDGIWDQQAVVVKVFADPIKAKYHTKREWRALKLLRERGLDPPAPLFYGKTDQFSWALVTEKIIDALTAREVWDKTTDVRQKHELLYKVSRELAKQHHKGVFQKDLHLGNFLLQGDELVALDPAQMCFLSREVSKSSAIAQLALLASAVPDEDTDTITQLCQEYAKARSWELGQLDMDLFWRELTKSRRNGVERALRKCLRTSKRYQRIDEPTYRGVAVRDFFEKADFHKFADTVDALMKSGQVLKNGNTCFVSRVNWAGEETVVKRYNHKGTIHSLRHTIKSSRAHRSWLHAHRLAMLNIATPSALAYLEQRKAKLVWKSYFVTQYVEGQNLYYFLRDSKVTEKQHSTVTQQVRELLDKLKKYHISHGDLKHSNILITENGPVLTDLDGMKAHRCNLTYTMRYRKDLKRHARQMLQRPTIESY